MTRKLARYTVAEPVARDRQTAGGGAGRWSRRCEVTDALINEMVSFLSKPDSPEMITVRRSMGAFYDQFVFKPHVTTMAQPKRSLLDE